MRIKIELTKNNTPVPFNNQKNLMGYLHSLLGENNIYHDKHKKSYSLSFLYGGKKVGNNLEFYNGASFYVTTKDENIINLIFSNIFKLPNFAFGMTFKGISIIEEEFYTEDNTFMMLSPTLIKLKDSNLSLTPKHENFEELFKEHIISKFKSIDGSLKIKSENIIINAVNSKTKKIMINNVHNTSFLTSIKIINNKKLSQLIYNYGLGQSNGCGFGCVCKIENHKKILNLEF